MGRGSLGAIVAIYVLHDTFSILTCSNEMYILYVCGSRYSYDHNLQPRKLELPYQELGIGHVTSL